MADINDADEMELAEMECVPCKGGVPALKGADLERLQQRLGSGWKVVDEHHLTKTYTFADYASTVAFVNGVAEVAEQQGHHPTISFTYGNAEVTIWTHKIDGLTESDFVFAAKADKVLDLLRGEGAVE
jgi:4a-hydroxytetrahydrobiopterin dehydratase